VNILFVGDIVGRPGRESVARWLPELCRTRQIDLVAANGENAAGGIGATPETLVELRELGVMAFTMGNHVWRKKSLAPALPSIPGLVRPANLPPGVPGQGAILLELKDGRIVGLLNLLGRVYMEPVDCPFRAADREIEELRRHTPHILVDIHAEATSEKVAIGWYLDGRCSAVAGTHTHVQTGDEWIMPKGTAYITDVGMCGPYHSVIGVETERVIKRFTTGMPQSFQVAKGPLIFSAVFIETDDATGRATGIERLLFRE
jgi:2',3'-cyclic-nucleotide 2'-phosphodiesterase